MNDATTFIPVRVAEAPPFAVEFYDEPRPAQAAPAGYFDQEAAEYEALGLTDLAKQSRLAPRTVGRRLTAEEVAVWRWRYPSVYASSLGFLLPPDQTVWEWGNLTWPVPCEVRALIRQHRDTFDRLEIWTPELRPAPRVGPTPILLGVRLRYVGPRLRDQRLDYYLLARWAEALEPFEAIRARAGSRLGRRAMWVRRIYAHGPPDMRFGGVVLMIGGGAITGLGVMLSPDVPGSTYFAPLLGGGLIALGAWVMWLSSRSMLRWACEYAGWVLEEESR